MTKNMTFEDINLIPELQRAIVKHGYTIPTPIQSKSIPGLLEGKDMIGIAQTGTGKTAAFVLPILQRMTEKYPRKIKTLILAPTRELAAQIGESIATYGEFLKFKHVVIFGGVSQGYQVSALRRGVDILVATPGRLLDLMDQGKLTLKDIEFFVLDEADRMLDMGFIRDIKKVIKQLPKQKQTLFFSATMSGEINKLAEQLLNNPMRVEVTPQATTVEKIEQCIYFADAKSKLTLLHDLFKEHKMGSVLIFTKTKHRANKVAVFLNDRKINTAAIHGNKSQAARTKAMKDFKTGAAQVLVATDIAARGIDIPNISHVINFELPNEPESYVHRIGRTARAGAEGIAYSFCEAQERNDLREIEKLIKQKIPVAEHKYHSTTAQHATGSAAKAPPKTQGKFQRSRSGDRGKPREGSRPRTSNWKDAKPSRTNTRAPSRTSSSSRSRFGNNSEKKKSYTSSYKTKSTNTSSKSKPGESRSYKARPRNSSR